MSAKAIKFGQNSDETLVDGNRIACDGGEDGHPKIYLSVNTSEVTICPYCSHKFMKIIKNTQN